MRALKKDWPDRFLEALAESGNVKLSCQAAGVGRRTAYDHRAKDAAFASAWADAMEEAADLLEQEAVRRAVEGVDKPVYQGGRMVGIVKEYSDTLLIFLLKGARPNKYRDNVKVDVSQLSDAELQRISSGES